MRRLLRGTGKPLQDQLVGPAGPFGRICTVGNVLDIHSGWSMAQCHAGWYNSWSPSVTICITAQRARNASVIVPELAEIGDNYEFVNQFRPLWSVPLWAQDVNFCDAKIERLFLSRKKEGCLNDRSALLHPDTVNLSRA